MPYIAAALGSNIEKQFRDALIADAALTGDLTLVTADRKLARVARSFDASVEEIA
jgi:predicted nucleic acid-binding protein